MLNYLLVALGGAIGSVARFWLNAVISQRYGETFPVGTLVINVTGSFLIGFFATATAPDGRWRVPPSGRAFFMVGICGGYTTFSSFSLQTLTLAQEGEWFRAGAYVLLSVALCLFAVWLGYVAAAMIRSTKGL